MFCTNCGNYIDDDATFCIKCGAKVERVEPEPKPYARPVSSPPREPYVPPRKTVPVAVPIAVGAVATIAIVGIIVLGKPSWGGSPTPVGQQEAPSGAFDASETDGSAEVSAEEALPEAEPAWAEPAEEPAAEEPVAWDGYVLSDSSTRLYTTSELEELSNWELFIARNEIYARHGRLFKSELLNNYFEGCDWYYGYIAPEDFDEDSLNETEKANAKAMLAIEQERGSEYL